MFQVFVKLKWFFSYYKKRYMFAVIGLITASLIGLVPPKVLGFIIDHIRFETLTKELLLATALLVLVLMVSHYIIDRKSTRLNSSHVAISYAVFCLKKKNKKS